MKRKYYCETIKPGFYLTNDRCVYSTGTKKGNKWIYLEVPNPEWTTLMWTCIEPYSINKSTYHKNNPTNFAL